MSTSPSVPLGSSAPPSALPLSADEFADFPIWARQSLAAPSPQERGPDSSEAFNDSGRSIFQHREELLDLILSNQVVLVSAATGAGKTTVIPKLLLEIFLGPVAYVLPSEQDARFAFERVSRSLEGAAPDSVSCRSDFVLPTEEDHSRCKVEFLSSVALIQLLQMDSELSYFKLIVLDDFQERAVASEFALTALSLLLKRRLDLKLVVCTSLETDLDPLSTFLPGSQSLRIGRNLSPVELFYTVSPEPDFIDAAASTTLQLHLTEPPAVFIVFLPSTKEIVAVGDLLHERLQLLGSAAPPMEISILSCSSSFQLRSIVFEAAKPGARHVILTSSFAASVPIFQGGTVVIDPGFCKTTVYNPRINAEALLVTPVSQEEARFRAAVAGNAGKQGKCFRLYTENAYKNELPSKTFPLVLRVPIHHQLLALRAMGLEHPEELNWLCKPSEVQFKQAESVLVALGALENDSFALTALGKTMAAFPLAPTWSKLLLESIRHNCTEEIIVIVALAAHGGEIFVEPTAATKPTLGQRVAKFASDESDFLTLLNIFNQWRQENQSVEWCRESCLRSRTLREAERLRGQIVSHLRHYNLPMPSCGSDGVQVRKAIAASLFLSAAKREGNAYKSIRYGSTMFISPSSGLASNPPALVVYSALLLNSKTLMSCVTAIEPEWLPNDIAH